LIGPNIPNIARDYFWVSQDSDHATFDPPCIQLNGHGRPAQPFVIEVLKVVAGEGSR
jgi:hypothetical protein